MDYETAKAMYADMIHRNVYATWPNNVIPSWVADNTSHYTRFCEAAAWEQIAHAFMRELDGYKPIPAGTMGLDRVQPINRVQINVRP